jgi:hypothetical protein
MPRPHKTVWTVVSAAVSASFALLALAANSPHSQSARPPAARPLGPTTLIEYLRELCDTVGGRRPGSKAPEQAGAWGVDKLRAAGVKKVAALASVLTWGLAEQPERPAPRQTRAEVE